MNKQNDDITNDTSVKDIQDYIIKNINERLRRVASRPYESLDTAQINAALAKAQGEFPSIEYNKEISYLKSKYANMDAIVRGVKSMLKANGLSVTHHVISGNGAPDILKTVVRHSSGQWISTDVKIIPPKNDPQAYASAKSRLKRTSLMDLLNVTCTEDNEESEEPQLSAPTQYYQQNDTSVIEFITDDQVEELEFELKGHPHITKMVLEGIKIKRLSDMPKSRFLSAMQRIRSIKAKEKEVK